MIDIIRLEYFIGDVQTEGWVKSQNDDNTKFSNMDVLIAACRFLTNGPLWGIQTRIRARRDDFDEHNQIEKKKRKKTLWANDDKGEMGWQMAWQ